MSPEEIAQIRHRFVAERVKWSEKSGGCLMWVRDGHDWSSQAEGNYPTPADATDALAFYEGEGVFVDWPAHDAAIASGAKGFTACGYHGCELEEGHRSACKITLWARR
jgi:hypothetical protein